MFYVILFRNYYFTSHSQCVMEINVHCQSAKSNANSRHPPDIFSIFFRQLSLGGAKAHSQYCNVEYRQSQQVHSFSAMR